MDAKAAVKIAKDYVVELFAEEKVENLGLEEVYKDDRQGEWYVTVGFSRPFDSATPGIIAAARALNNSGRVFKVINISDQTSQGGCKKFCVNGHLAGDCLYKGINDHHKAHQTGQARS